MPKQNTSQAHYKIGPVAIGNDGKSSAEVLIYGNIGKNWYDDESVSAKEFVSALNDLDVDEITVRVNSYGGVVSEGISIFNALRRHKADVYTEIDGVAYSIASLIAMAGDVISMADNGLFMIHAPSTYAIGNAVDMRKAADVLDKYADAMKSAYVRDNGPTIEQIDAWLKDGEDHYFTASEALDIGLIDCTTDSVDIAASLNGMDLGKFLNPAALAAAKHHKPTGGQTMPNTVPPAASHHDEPQNVVEIQKQASDAALATLSARNQTLSIIRAASSYDEIKNVCDECMADVNITLAEAQAKITAAQAAVNEAQAIGSLSGVPPVTPGVTDREKAKIGLSVAIAHRMKMGDDDRSNEFRGLSLARMAEKCLALAGHKTIGMTTSEIASRVLAAHSTSDFPNLLMDAANKKLQAAYQSFPSTWRMWCGVGSVSDFKTVNLIRLGSFNSLATILEGGEYTEGTIGEEKEQLTPLTKGKFISLTRQMIINDDLSGFSRRAMMLGRAAARTVNADAYGVINNNGAMSDGTAMFHADHANLAGTGAAPSLATISAGRSAMRKQTPPGTNATDEFLNIMPRSILVPVVLEDTVREIVTSETDIAKSNSRSRNPIKDWGPLDVVSDPVLDATSVTAWYLAADPIEAPLVEIHFLDGNEMPYIASEEEFLSDAIRSKVRLDYGVAGNEYRGGYKNAGA
jgi:ATP-dependent protease ClpP protease subunit